MRFSIAIIPKKLKEKKQQIFIYMVHGGRPKIICTKRFFLIIIIIIYKYLFIYLNFTLIFSLWPKLAKP
jgi:hypothetical protein